MDLHAINDSVNEECTLFYWLVGSAAVLHRYLGAHISLLAQNYLHFLQFFFYSKILDFEKYHSKISCRDAQLIILHKYCMSTFYGYEWRCNI